MKEAQTTAATRRSAASLTRPEFLEQLQQLYVNCGPANSSIDVDSRFSTPEAMTIDPDDQSPERKEDFVLTPQAQKAQDLYDFVDPQQNFRQLMRMVFADLQVYRGAYVELISALRRTDRPLPPAVPGRAHRLRRAPAS